MTSRATVGVHAFIFGVLVGLIFRYYIRLVNDYVELLDIYDELEANIAAMTKVASKDD